MCFMDWRIGRLIRSVPMKTSIPGASDFIIAPNPQRVGITFLSNDAPGVFYMYPDAFGAAGGVGEDLNFAGEHHFTLATHGDLPTRGWRVHNSDVAADTLVWIEYFAPEDVLRLGLEQIRNQYPI